MGERIAVIGAGVIGMSIAHELGDRDVTVLHDQDPLETTSAVAGALWFPYAAESSATVDAMLSASLQRFIAIAAEHADAGVDLRSGIVIERSPQPDRAWTAQLQAAEVDASELPAGATGLRTIVPLATMTEYLPWLRAQCEERGVRFERRVVDDVDALTGEFDTVIVAAGARGGTLLGDDESVVPIRGQVVRVERRGMAEFVLDDANPAGLVYVLPRRDCVVLGGTNEPGETDVEPDPAVEAAIIERCTALVPALAGARVLSRAVGLRPGREKLRIEEVPGRGPRVIAAYGHGGSGMTLSWGTAERVVALLA
ncbi:FAD-dependent oxidoreductase [Agrococcus sp. ProA11]|uniref:NAD(P)/FAD-dependent oxidoreductase n=1 Tax=Agrococcus chionoecetis TaxID=3153752 RepID=UPI0032606670